MNNPPRIVIIGAGPTGLGAAYRLNELNYDNYVVYEGSDHVGGLAATIKDEKGFFWDLGGHVAHSHYKYFDQAFEKALKGEYFIHQRESWVFIFNRFIPYPYQNNIHRLPVSELLKALVGLLKVKKDSKHPQNFEEWILKVFGKGVAEQFLLPYNKKVWAIEPVNMNYKWVGDRVSTLDLKRLLVNIIRKKDDVSWGPNAVFKFPKIGGTGKIWESVFELLPKNKFRFKKELVSVDIYKKKLFFYDKTSEDFDYLVSTIPLNILSTISNINKNVVFEAEKLFKTQVYLTGVGLKGNIPDQLKTKCWIYFPEDQFPFYRITLFSNYSPNNVPNPQENWSILVESAGSLKKPISEGLSERVVQSLKKAGIIDSASIVIDLFSLKLPFGYPVPTLERDDILDKIQQEFEKKNIYSRGRFGSWKYEISNQDHTFMQGKEVIDRILGKGDEHTFKDPLLAIKGY